MKARISPALFVAAIVVAGSGCASSTAGRLPGPAVLDIKMTEYRFDYDSKAIKQGRVLFKAQNKGELDHQIILVALPKDGPPIREQLESADRKAVTQLASFPAKPPGGRGSFAVDLESGRYAMICFVADPDGKQHGAKGMASEFTLK